MGAEWGTKGWKFCFTSNDVKSNVVTLGVTTKNRKMECIPFETADIPRERRLTYSDRGMLREKNH